MASRSALTPIAAVSGESVSKISTGSRAYARYAWCVLAYVVAAIVWGTFVRASGSGDGCGAHWPRCDGELVPLFTGNIEKTIEATHRLTSGLILPMVIVLWVWARSLFRGEGAHPARRAAWWAIIGTAIEVIIGAVLVVQGWVDRDTSTGRVTLGIAHLVSTFMLVASIGLAAWWGGGAARVKLRGQGPLAGALWGAIIGITLLGVTGAIAALGDMIFPSESLFQGVMKDFDPTSHYLLQLRVWHPWLAATMSLYVILVAGIVSKLRPSPDVIRAARFLTGIFVAQMLVGVANFVAMAPIVLQMLHLLLADFVWLAVVLLMVSALAEGVPQVEVAQDDSLTALLAGHEAPTVGRATWKDYVVLTKPRVISLLLVTTVAAMFIAKGGWPGWMLVVATSLGFYMAAGAANAINMVLERDLDFKMKRTSERPLVTQVISSRQALRFALALAVGSFVLLTWAAPTPMAALMALSGLVFYVVVYTIMLKRRTWHNIVIGGAAGAFPPLVGWAAVTGNISQLALVLFAIIFLWTPVHFWALAILLKDDYNEAGVPMLPCVRGERATVIQIFGYTILTIAISLVPLFLRNASGEPLAGVIYFGAAVLLNIVLLAQSVRLYRTPDRPAASALFHYSMLYLALLFVAFAAERAGWPAVLATVLAGWACFELEKLARPLGKTVAT